LIIDEGLPDLKIYPKKDSKLSVADANEIIDDSALKPVEGDKKLYIISDFDTTAPLFQNKLLKILEEPPEGVYFLLGASSLSPILSTIRSRVKLLEIQPFSDEQIISARKRDCPKCCGLAGKSSKHDIFQLVARSKLCRSRALQG
jgi:DNA polymerase-3 subunit delta'